MPVVRAREVQDPSWSPIRAGTGLRRPRTRGRGAPGSGLLAAAVFAGCEPASMYHEPRPVPLVGAPSVEATAAALLGDWSGRYDGPLYDWAGDLRLSLRPTPGSAGGPAGVAGIATVSGASARVDSARVIAGHVVLWLAPYADQQSGATIWMQLDGTLAADTLGGRLRADGAATVAPEHRGGWRVVRVARAAGPGP